MYALEITGILDTIKVRSVSKQTKPYRALVDVVKNQATFLSTNIEGTLVGFYAPSTVKSIMVQGMHLHFLSKDEKKGGHVLAISTTQNIHCRIACYTKLHLDMVEMSEATNKVGFNKKDMQESIEKVEK
jgi:acetolactate decarboxylase